MASVPFTFPSAQMLSDGFWTRDTNERNGDRIWVRVFSGECGHCCGEEAEDGPRSTLTSQGRQPQQRSSGIATKCHVTSVAIFGWQETCSKPVCEEFVNVELGNLMAFSG